MDKRFWVCGLLVSVAALLLDFLVHGALLKGDYDALVARGLMRAPEDAQHYLPYMVGAHLLVGYGLTWLYRQGVHRGRSNVGQGLRFGIAIALVATIPGYLIYYAVQPLPTTLVHKQLLFGTAATLLLGLLLAWMQPGRKAL
ncbi:MAG: hypothetical protein ACTHKZ_08165 [Lysobacteraceae bacterium]